MHMQHRNVHKVWKDKSTVLVGCITYRETCFVRVCVHTCSVRCVTCASSSFSPLAGDAAAAGIFLADEGLDVGVEDFGVVVLDLDAPAAHKRLIRMQIIKT